MASCRKGKDRVAEADNSDGMAGPVSPERPTKGGKHRNHALRQIRDMIIHGDLEPGMRLRECALAEQLGMSRTPVREALRMLSVEGLVKTAPHRSVTVNAPDMREAADIFIILGELGRLAGQLCSYRAICGRRATVNRLYNDLAHFYADDDVPAFLKTSWRMHEAVVQSSRSWPLMLVWARWSRGSRGCRSRPPATPGNGRERLSSIAGSARRSAMWTD